MSGVSWKINQLSGWSSEKVENEYSLTAELKPFDRLVNVHRTSEQSSELFEFSLWFEPLQ